MTSQKHLQHFQLRVKMSKIILIHCHTYNQFLYENIDDSFFAYVHH